MFLAPANESDKEIVPILLEGTVSVVLGDRNYWLPDLQAFLRVKGILLQATFQKAPSPQAAAYQSSVLGQIRYLIDTVFGQLTDRRTWCITASANALSRLILTVPAIQSRVDTITANPVQAILFRPFTRISSACTCPKSSLPCSMRS